MRVSIAYSIHRPEIVPLAAKAMRAHQTIVLEEPETPGFADMLAGNMAIDDYLMGADFEYPLFSRRMCELLRELHAQGRDILQIDPYMEVLAAIHERFANGGSPDDIPDSSLERAVYRAEHAWSGTLLAFYRTSAQGSFRETVDAVKLFGKADAARGRLRDDLRAQAIARLVKELMQERPDSGPVLVEAGYIHVYLLTALRRRLPPGCELRPLYLMESVVRGIEGRRQHMGPGDVLTISYVYNPDRDGHEADLQAARSLVRIKILQKDELEGDGQGFPHTRDEVQASRLVRSLDYAGCERAWRAIRRLPTPQAREWVARYVEKQGGAA